LHALEPGQSLRVIGPQGFFTRAPDGPPSLFVATGTGVTPLRSMLRAAVAAGSTTPIWMVLGVRRESDVLYDEELSALARAHAHVRFEPTLSQSAEHWSGRRGYVQTHVRDLMNELETAAGSPPHAYVCGLQRMVGSVRDLLRKEMSLSRERVHTERYD
jgi:NAD(P)H-flavin reductase